MLSGNEDIRGQLKEILLGLNEIINREQMDLGGIYEVEFLDNLIRIFSSGILDEKSFYSPVEGHKEFVSQNIVSGEPDKKLRLEKLQRIKEKLQKTLNPAKIEQYVLDCMNQKDEMQISEFPLENIEDFVKIIYVRLYAQRKNMKYKIELDGTIEKNGFRFKNFKIRRK